MLGLDIATTTGYNVIEGGKLTHYGVIELDETLPYPERYKVFRKEIERLIKAHKPQVIALEQVFQGRNVKTTAYLNALRGIAMSLIPSKCDFRTNAVSSIRKEVLGAGKKHDKEEVFEWAVSKFGLTDFTFKKHNDITDSILISYWASNLDTEKS